VNTNLLGKLNFLYYVLLLQLREKLPMAYQLSDCFVLFEASGAQEYPQDWRYHQVIPEGTLVLADARVDVQTPCDAFLHAAQECRARIIQANSPNQASSIKQYVMNYFSVNEIKVLGFVKLDVCRCFILAETFRLEPYLVSTLATSYAFTINGVLMHVTVYGLHRNPMLNTLTNHILVLPWAHLSCNSLLLKES
jgi:hypothetical protein